MSKICFLFFLFFIFFFFLAPFTRFRNRSWHLWSLGITSAANRYFDSLKITPQVLHRSLYLKNSLICLLKAFLLIFVANYSISIYLFILDTLFPSSTVSFFVLFSVGSSCKMLFDYYDIWKCQHQGSSPCTFSWIFILSVSELWGSWLSSLKPIWQD